MASDVTVGYLPVGHDPSIAIVDDTGVVAVAEEERYSRIKRGRFITDPRWVFDVLDEFGVDPERVRSLAVPNIVALQERRPASSLEGVPRFGQARVVSSIINRVLARLPRVESVEHYRHHLCHAASTYLASPFDRAAVVTVDGMGETETATISLGVEGTLELLHSTELPNSLGYLYQALAWWSGLEGAEREGKFMGLASWGAPTSVDLLRRLLIAPDDEALVSVSADLASHPVRSSVWNSYVSRHLGPRRNGDPEVPDPVAADIAASIQVIIEESLLRYCRRARDLTRAANLCLAGGVFMNTVANGVIQRSAMFDQVFVQPMASDNGLALGAALLSHRRRVPNAPRWVMKSAALGSKVAPPARRTGDLRVEDLSDRILSGQVVGWVRGRAEVGARALGQRSVLADARAPLTPSRINDKLKRREKWRPFAPIILEEDASAWGLPRSPFMTFVHPVEEAIREQFPAVFHVDGSARLQTVGADGDPLLRSLLLNVRERIGTGILLNTSLNGPGMPIVRTQSQALDLFRTSDLDCLMLEDAIVERANLATMPRTCECGLSVETLLQLVEPEQWSCLATHAKAVHRVKLRDEGHGVLGGDLPEIGYHDAVTVLLPTWIDLVAECAPRLFVWLQSLQARLATPVVLIDANHRTVTIAEMLSDHRLGSGSLPSEIETHWLNAVER